MPRPKARLSSPRPTFSPKSDSMIQEIDGVTYDTIEVQGMLFKAIFFTTHPMTGHLKGKYSVNEAIALTEEAMESYVKEYPKFISWEVLLKTEEEDYFATFTEDDPTYTIYRFSPKKEVAKVVEARHLNRHIKRILGES